LQQAVTMGLGGGVALGTAVGLVVAPVANLLFTKLCKNKSGSLAQRSTTSSAAGGAAAYETRKAVDEYVQFHFGDPKDVLPYENGPKVK